ncbi:MAG: CRISPR-associated protein Csx3 [Parcubacteria group bacterium]|nr:CRISPR-associated protein Csx3 [Parcubacteria group bacterium]
MIVRRRRGSCRINHNYYSSVLNVVVGRFEEKKVDNIIRDVVTCLGEMILDGIIRGGKILRVKIDYRPATVGIPVAIAIGRATADLYRAVAVFDPELAKYVVTATTYEGHYKLGELID